jgi:cytochrome c556
MIKTKTMMAALALGLGGIATVAWAATPAETIKARRVAFKDMGKSMKAIGGQLKSGTPDVAVIRGAAATLAATAPKLEHAFPKGTGPEAGVKTEASADIWAKPAEFAKLMGELQTKTKALDGAAKGGDLAKIGAATGDLGSTCKACHQSFKKD